MTEANVHQIWRRFKIDFMKALADADGAEGVAPVTDLDKLVSEFAAEFESGSKPDPGSSSPVHRSTSGRRSPTGSTNYLDTPRPRPGTRGVRTLAGEDRGRPRLQSTKARPEAGPSCLPSLRRGADQARRADRPSSPTRSGSDPSRRASTHTTTRWSTARSPPRVSPTGCSRRSPACSAPRARSSAPPETGSAAPTSPPAAASPAGLPRSGLPRAGGRRCARARSTGCGLRDPVGRFVGARSHGRARRAGRALPGPDPG